MLIREITLSGILSFGSDTPPLEMKPLNVLIGPNGSGKSNFLEAISLLQAAPKRLDNPVRKGGVEEWIWKGKPDGIAKVVVKVSTEISTPSPTHHTHNLHHEIEFKAKGTFKLVGEAIQTHSTSKPPSVLGCYRFQDNQAVLHDNNEEEHILKINDLSQYESILSQREDPDLYPRLSELVNSYESIRLYREWQLGRSCPSKTRQAQKADLSSSYLEEDFSNLWLFLNQLKNEPRIKKKILSHLSDLYDGIDDIEIRIVPGGYVEVMLTEGDYIIPASRLSDGTIRYLCLLAILCDPNPPKLICIEEPELGLHPDLIPKIADLLIEASEQTQIIITTHSDILVDCMSEQPESVVVCQKEDGATTMTRLKEDEVKPFLEDYRLGQLWSSGQIGGNRW